MQLDELCLLLPSSKNGEIITCIIPLLENVCLLSCSHIIADRAQPLPCGAATEGVPAQKNLNVSFNRTEFQQAIFFEHRTGGWSHWRPSEHSLMDTRGGPSSISLISRATCPAGSAALLNPLFWLVFDERRSMSQLYCNVDDMADLASSVYPASSAALGGACPALSAVPKISRNLVAYLAGLIVVTPYIGGTSGGKGVQT